MKRDIEYIKEQFEGDGLKAPENLSEDAMMAKLAAAPEPDPAREVRPAAKKPSPWRTFGPLALAACLLVAVAVPAVNHFTEDPADPVGVSDTAVTAKAEDSLTWFADYKDIRQELKEIGEKQQLILDESVDYGAPAAPTPSDSAALASNAAGEAKSSGSHSDTYVQVEGVDEADIIKTDGKCIYYITGDGTLRIASVSQGETETLATIRPGGEEAWFNDLYLYKEKLIVIGTSYDEDSLTTVTTYDISNPEKPKKLQQYKQTGDVVSSRMAEGFVYLVTRDWVDQGGRIVPYCTGDKGYKKLMANDICMMPAPMDTSYAVLGAIDITSGKHVKARTKAVLGASEQIYSNGDNLYIAGPDAEDNEQAYWYGADSTRLLKASLKDGKVDFVATAKIKGNVNNQFSMDEKDGYLRIATTSMQEDKNVNNLYILDEDLEQVGSVTGFAKDEHIEAVRFIGDRGYVITYEETDPLFVLDLSDPKEPKIDGSVKISGFSTLLVPVDEKTLLGIGWSTETTKEGEALDGTKLVVFDISDPSEPKVADSQEFSGLESEAQYEHKALLVNEEQGYYGIPYGEWSENDSYDGGVMTFSVKDQKLQKVKKHRVAGDTVRRAIYIDDHIYALRADDRISGFPASE